MASHGTNRYRRLAEQCVANMGDIFWDFEPSRDLRREFTEPSQVALLAIEKTLRDLAESMQSIGKYSRSLNLKYAQIVRSLPNAPSDDAIIESLTSKGDMERATARDIVRLARRNGVQKLSRAIVLASALGIAGNTLELDD